MGLFLENSLAESFMIKGVYEMPFKFLGSTVYLTTSDISCIILTILILIIGIFVGTKIKNSTEPPKGIQNFFEMAIEFLNNMGDGILNENRKFQNSFIV